MKQGTQAHIRPISRRKRIWLATFALLLFFFLALDSLVDDSPTMDEQNHLARGLAFLITGDPRLSLEHPPLINSLSALPVLTIRDIRLPIDHPSWERREGWYEFADLLLWQYNHDVERMIFLARMPIVFLLIALGLVGYVFAVQFWAAAEAGLIALLLLLFEPNLMAHGRYATTDLGGTLFSFATTWLLWRLWQLPERHSWSRWLWASLAMGLAFGSKLSVIGFAPVWLAMALLPIYPTSTHADGQEFNFAGWMRRAGRRTLQFLGAGLLSLGVVWALYGFQWRAFDFVTPPLEGLSSASGPMPTFWAGVEQALRVGSGGRAAFMLGRFSQDGFLSYFPLAFAVKTPLVLLILLATAIVVLLGNRLTRRRAVFLLTPAILFLGLSMWSGLNIGYRHVLPMLPYLLLLVGGLVAPEAAIRPATFGHLNRQPLRAIVAAGTILLILTTLWIHPHYLSYFNQLAGGPANGYRVLVDSNLDWGQDLLRLREWMTGRDVDGVKLAWFGSADPDYYDLSYEPLPGLGRDRFFRLWWDVPFDPENPEPGIYAISTTNLWEMPLREEEKRVFAWFRAREPDDRVGYSILIYDVR